MTKSRVALSVTTCALLLVAASSASAALPCDLVAPDACASARDITGYAVGVYTGKALVDQIWLSPAVDQQIDNWDILHEQVTLTIPTVVNSAYKANWNQYIQCRVQGFLDGTLCEMNTLDPIPGCQLNGADWGSIGAAVYCGLSTALGGLADMPPWFIREPVSMCGDAFQSYCEDTYRYGATNGGDALLPEVEAFYAEQGIEPAIYLQGTECVPYTEAPFDVVFKDSVDIDCSYIVPVP